MRYVVAAEVALALSALHLRCTAPYLFGGAFAKFWPLIIVGVAYLGVGLAEWFRRRNVMVLAEPLERSGVFLPVLPAIAFWAAPPEVASPTLQFALLMGTIGALYSGLGLLRRSFIYGALAAVAFQAAFWSLLTLSDSLSFFRHPQVWLIPPALCVLAASYLQRKRLSESQLTTVRYLTSTVVVCAPAPATCF